MMQAFGGATALMYACQQCKEVEVLQILRKQPHSIKERDRTLKTPLHYCAENPNISCAEVILKFAPELANAQDENGYCTLHLAVIAGNKPLIKLLIMKGADVNLHDNEGHSAVHWAIAFSSTDCMGNLEFAERALLMLKFLMNKLKHENILPPQTVGCFSDCVSKSSPNNPWPLYRQLIFVSSEKEALEMIIRAGANPSTPDIHGGYPLHYAVQMCGSNSDYVSNADDIIRVVETLINFGVDVNVKDKDGRQPILWAASAGSADAVIYLVSSGACVEAADKDGLTALHCAASRGHTTTLETLISLCGANVDLIDGNGCSAIFYSVTLGHADATELLLQLGAEPNRQDRKGRTPAHCGAAKGQLETLRILQKRGGNLWMRNVKGDIPLHEAVASGRKDLVLWLLSQNSEAINIANNDGRCPLHIASMYNNTEMVKVLLDSKSLVNPVMRTNKGVLMTPLNVALCKGHRSCGKYLQLHGGVPFSKVSKMDPEPAFAVRISPSDNMMTLKAEKTKENLTSSQSKISVSRSSTDIQGNQEVMKAENIDKKKVYRRRKKKKSPSSKNPQDSDSEEQHCSLTAKSDSIKVKTLVGRKSEKSNEDGDGDEGKDENEEKMKPKKVQLDFKTIKKENNLQNSSIESKIGTNKKNKISEEDVQKIKSEPKPMQRNKSFNETKNVSDLSPEDFPPLMQAINQLDSVIMEPDMEISKSENDYSELRSQGAATSGLSNDVVTVEITKEQEIVQKINGDAKTISNEALVEKDLEENEKQNVEEIEEQEKSVKVPESSNTSNGANTRKEETDVELTELKNSGDKNTLEKCVASPESLNSEGSVEKDLKPKKKNENFSEMKEEDKTNEKGVAFASGSLEDIPFHSKINKKNEDADKSIHPEANIEDEVDADENIETKTEFKSTDCPKEVDKKKLESGVDYLSNEVTTEIFVEREIEKILNGETNYLGDSPQNEENSSHFPEIVTESPEKEEDIRPSERQTSEEVRTVFENEPLVVSSGQNEPKISRFERKDFSNKETSEALDSFGNSVKIMENNEKPHGDHGGDVSLLETLGVQNNPHEVENKTGGGAEQLTEPNILQPKEKRFADIKQSTEIEMKKSPALLNIKREDAIDQKTGESVSKQKGERKDIVETVENYEDSKFRNDDTLEKKPNSPEQRQFRPPKVSRLCRRHKDFKEDLNQISVTQLVQNTIRKYHMERGIFYQLLELKRYQIRSGKANEQVLVKRLADEYERSRVFLGMKPFSGLYKFREFEKFLYDQLKALNARRSLIIPDIKSYDDIDALSGFLKKSRYKIISDLPERDLMCTRITQRCHHSACAYTSVPCSAYVTDLHRHKHHKLRRECFFPRIDQRPPLKPESQKFTELPATLELIQGSEKHVITLPQSSASLGKRYYVTFTIKGAPAFKEEDFVESSKDFFKHRHAKSV